MNLFTLDEAVWSSFQTGLLQSVEDADEEKGTEVEAQVDIEKQRWDILHDALNIPSVQDNPRSMIVFEFIYHIVHFCNQSNFTFAQMSGCLAVFGEIFESFCIIDESLEKSKDDAIGMFSSRMSQFSQPNPEIPTLFDVDAVREITKLFADTIIKHFDAYRYVMSELPVERVENVKLVVQTPLSVLPMLSDGEAMDPSTGTSDADADAEGPAAEEH